MVFNEMIRQKLTDLLRPWLLDEPRLELKLGLLRFHGVAEDLSLNTSALNDFLHDSSAFCFKDVRIEQLSLSISIWSFPAITIEIHGFHATLLVREANEEEGLTRRCESTDRSLEDKKRILSEIDPQMLIGQGLRKIEDLLQVIVSSLEGSALHDAVERISDIGHSRKRITSILHTFLTNCCLSMLDIHLLVQSPFSNEFSCLLEMKELNVESQTSKRGCFFLGILSSLFVPSVQSSFNLGIRGFEVGLKNNDRISCVIPSTYLLTSIHLKDLQLISLNFFLPNFQFFFSPSDMSIILTLNALSSREAKCARHGKQLWRIASSRISSLLSAPRFSLHKVVRVIQLWLHYVHAYKYLLLLVGYPVENMMKRSATMMSCDQSFSRSVKQQRKLVLEIEKDLPSVAIAQARKFTRHSAAFNVQHAKGSYEGSTVNNCLNSFWKILQPLTIICIIICHGFNSILKFFFQTLLGDRLKDNGYGNSSDQYCVSATVGEFSIIVFPGLLERPVSDTCFPFTDLRSFHLSVDALFLRYTAGVCEKCFSFFSGQLKVVSFLALESSSNTNYLKGYESKKFHDLKTNLWSEPAQIPYSSKSIEADSSSDTQRASDHSLECILEELYVNWKNCCTKFEGSKIQNLESPFFLCEIKSFLTHQSLKNPSAEFWKCSLAVGKLNIILEYSSIVSIALLVRLMQEALCLHNWNKRVQVLVSSTAAKDPPLKDWSRKCMLYLNRFGLEMFRIFPEKHIQIGAYVTGSHIQILLQNKRSHDSNKDANHLVRQDDLHLSFDVHTIELSVLPALRYDLNLSDGYGAICDAELGCSDLKEPYEIDIPKSDEDVYRCQVKSPLDIYLKFNGFNACLDESPDDQRLQIIVLSPTTIEWSSLREEFCSLGTIMVTFSGVLRWMTSGLTILFFMDELFVLSEEATDLFSAVSRAFTMSHLSDGVNWQELSRQEAIFSATEHETPPMSTNEWESSLFIKSTFELKLVHIVLYNSRDSNGMNSMINADPIAANRLATPTVPDYGIGFSIAQAFIESSLKDGKMEVFVDFSECRSVIFRFPIEISKGAVQSEIKNLLLHSLNSLYEFYLSNCKLSLWLRFLQNGSSSESVSNAIDASTSDSRFSHLLDNNSSGITKELSMVQASSPTSSHWLLANIILSDIYLAAWSLKNNLAGAHKSNMLDVSFSVGGSFQTISCQSQGGSIFLETMALVIFVQCLTSYCCCINNLSLAVPSSELYMFPACGENVATLNSHPGQGTENMHREEKEEWKALNIALSKLSLVLVSKNESGKLHEFLFEVDVHSNFEVENMMRKFSFGITKLSILSQFLCENTEMQTKEIQTADFSSQFIVKGPAIECVNKSHGVHDNASCSRASISQNEPCADDSASGILPLTPESYILKELNAFVAVEGPLPRVGIDLQYFNYLWVGRGLISGVDVTISLLEIQMILSAVESFSGIFSREKADSMENWQLTNNQKPGRGLDEIVSDGSIVAIQDVHQHMYIAVEGAGSKNSLVGVFHYSLVGERALFRVKYHKPSRWKSSVQWFSLISLHAKTDSGKPLRLNYRPGSSFVDISSCNDNGWALWRMLPYKPESCKDDTELESYNHRGKNMFYLVNKKNNNTVAFVDGIPEFVSSPVNPFKWKVFSGSLPSENLLVDSWSLEAPRNNLQDNSDVDGGTSSQTRMPRCINITFDKVTLTIVHEISNTTGRFPLLQGSIRTTEFIVQFLYTKFRVMSRINILLYYFDAQRNLWREFLHQVGLCIFYRSRFSIRDLETACYRVPVQLYATIKEWNMLLTELSLDILLFVVGKLNIAGPYAVRHSAILANCCKIENRSGLTLFCHFYDNQDVSVAKRQSTTIYLRHLASAAQSPEASLFSIQLVDHAAFSTSPIRLSFLEARVFTCRTRIVSLQGSKTYPGPFVVIEISRGTEDGLSIIVSPLLRIHNETDFSMELCFQKPQQKQTDFASMILKKGDTIDDSVAAFDAITFSGGWKKALMSLCVGNFLLSFRPKMMDDHGNFKNSSVQWSEKLKGGKPVRLSGLFNKLSYQVRQAFAVTFKTCSLSTACCSLESQDGRVASLHFLLQSVKRDVSAAQSDNFEYAPGNMNSPITLQEQKEIFLLPTVRVSNFLEWEIYVTLNDSDPYTTTCFDNIGNQATIPSGSTVNLYADPATIYFSVSLVALSSSCKPINSGDCVKKLQKQKNDVHHLDIELEFSGGTFFAFMRLSSGTRGILQIDVFAKYTIRNETNLSFLCFTPIRKPPSREEIEKLGSISPELGYLLPPMSTKSWLMRYNKVHLKLLEENASEAQLDLDALSGLTEIKLEVVEETGLKNIEKLGVCSRPSVSKAVPSQIISLSPRYLVLNESNDVIIVRQCYLEDEIEGMITINSKQKMALRLREITTKKRELTIFENFIRKHKNDQDDSFLFVQFRPNEAGLNWSGPVCLASLGRFFLKFRRSLEIPGKQKGHVHAPDNNSWEFAAVNVVEEGPTLVLHFHRPPNIDLPYRIENCLRDGSITYYQKGSQDAESLRSGDSVNYVWDDLTLPHKLVVQINDVHLLHEVNLDKVRPWKSFYRVRQHRGLGLHLPLGSKLEDRKKTSYGQLIGDEVVKWGYELYADGLTRVLRLCEFSHSKKKDTLFNSNSRMQLRVSYFAISLLECTKQKFDTSESSIYTPIIVAKLGNINLDSILTDQQKCYRMRVQSLSVDERWIEAPFAAMLRNHQSEYSDTNDNVLQIVFILLSSSSNVKLVKYSSLVLQPLDLNIDEETLMKIVPFWRTSLSDSKTQRQQYYFDHFEIHPIKIVASFLPQDSYSSYNSAQETLRSLLHSVIKVYNESNLHCKK